MVLKTSPHPNAAQLFAQLHGDREGQELSPSAGFGAAEHPALITNDGGSGSAKLTPDRDRVREECPLFPVGPTR